MSSRFAETDLYPPIRDYLIARGYTVRSEVEHCDVVAVREDELVVIELKRTFNADLLVQATKRQRTGASVYVAVPRPSAKGMGKWRGYRHLLRRLELGLIFVSLGEPKRVEIAFHPVPYERKRIKRERSAVIREVEGRTYDLNQGGSSRRKLVTAYRESAIRIALYLSRLGPSTPKRLRQLGSGPKALSILSRNVYGWFERVDRGVYALTSRGTEELRGYPELIDTFSGELTELLAAEASAENGACGE